MVSIQEILWLMQFLSAEPYGFKSPLYVRHSRLCPLGMVQEGNGAV